MQPFLYGYHVPEAVQRFFAYSGNVQQLVNAGEIPVFIAVLYYRSGFLFAYSFEGTQLLSGRGVDVDERVCVFSGCCFCGNFGAFRMFRAF